MTPPGSGSGGKTGQMKVIFKVLARFPHVTRKRFVRSALPSREREGAPMGLAAHPEG